MQLCSAITDTGELIKLVSKSYNELRDTAPASLAESLEEADLPVVAPFKNLKADGLAGKKFTEIFQTKQKVQNNSNESAEESEGSAEGITDKVKRTLNGVRQVITSNYVNKGGLIAKQVSTIDDFIHTETQVGSDRLTLDKAIEKARERDPLATAEWVDVYDEVERRLADKSANEGVVSPDAESHQRDFIDTTKQKDILRVLFIGEHIFGSVQKLTDALINVGISEGFAKATARRFVKFKEVYRKSVQPNLLADTEASAEEKPLSMLGVLTEEGNRELPDSVLFSTMLGAQVWMAERGSSADMNRQEIGELLYNDRKAFLSPDEFKVLKGHGNSQRSVAIKRMGQVAGQLLNIKVQQGNIKNAGYYTERLNLALGLLGYSVYARMPASGSTLIQEVSTPKLEFEKAEVTNRNYNSGDSLYTVKMANVPVVTTFLKSLQTASPELEKLTGDSVVAAAPTSEPQTPNFNVRGQLSGLSTAVKKDLTSKFEQPWVRNNTYTHFEGLTLDVIHSLTGKRTSVEIKGLHIDEREGAESKNTGLDRELQAITDYAEITTNPFYLAYGVMPQGRVNMLGPISPQGSKIHRHIYKVGVPVPEIAPNSDTLTLFKLAVAQAFDQDIDKTDANNGLQLFNNLYANPNTQAAIDAVGTDALGAALLTLHKDYPGSNLSLLEGVVALAEYKKADAGAKSFQSDIQLETDGVTNGFALSLLQFPTLLIKDGKLTELGKKMLNCVGITLSDQTGDFGTFLADPKNLDAYEALAEIMGNLIINPEELLDIMEATTENDRANILKKFKALSVVGVEYLDSEGNLNKKIMRKIAKQPFMIFNYGAGLDKIITEMLLDGEGVIPSFRKKLVTQQKQYTESGKKEKEKVFKEVSRLFGAFNELVAINVTDDVAGKFHGENYPGISYAVLQKALDKGNLHSKSLEKFYPQLKFNLRYTLKPLMKEAFDKFFGSAIDARQNLISAFEMQYFIFDIKLKKAIAAHQKATGNTRITSDDVKSIIKKQGLKDFVPKLLGPLADADTFVTILKARPDLKDPHTPVRNQMPSVAGKKSAPTTSVAHFKDGFTAPQMAAMVRSIHHIDSAILVAVGLGDSGYLSLYDAIMASVDTIEGLSDTYNNKFLDFSEQIGILDQTTNRLLRQFDTLTDAEYEALVKKFNAVKYAKGKNVPTVYGVISQITTFNGINNEARKVLFRELRKDGTRIQQMYLPDTSTVVQEDTQEVTHKQQGEFDFAETKDDLPPPVSGSAGEHLSEAISKVMDSVSLKQNVEQIFQQLTAISSAYINPRTQKAEHKHLGNVLQNVLGPVLESLDGITLDVETIDEFTRGGYDAANKHIRIQINQNTPPSYTGQSAAEVYVHELLHPLIDEALKTDLGFKNEAQRLFDAIAPQFSVEDFLYHRNGKVAFHVDEVSERASAQQQFEYFTTNRSTERTLAEFLIYSMTNKFVVQKLQNLDQGRRSTKMWEGSSFLNKLINLIDRIVGKLTSIYRKPAKAGSDYARVLNLVKTLHGANERRRGQIIHRLKLDAVGKGVGKVRDALHSSLSIIAKTSLKALQSPIIQNRAIRNAAYNLQHFPALKNVKTVEAFRKAVAAMTPTDQARLMADLASDMVLGNQSTAAQSALYVANHEIDSHRKSMTDAVISRVRNSFARPLTKIEKTSLTRVLVKTDLAALLKVGMTSADIINLIKHPGRLNARIMAYASSLNISSNAYLKQQTSELANLMIAGNSRAPVQNLNAAGIVADDYKRSHKGVSEERENTVRTNLVDAYISLLALQGTSSLHKEALTELFDEESKRGTDNGVTFVLAHLAAFKKSSQKTLFGDNPNQMQKGYFAQIFNPYHDLTVASVDQTAELHRAGYKPASEELTTLGVITTQAYRLFLNKNMPSPGRTSGILSYTSEKAKGTTLFEILSREPSNQRTDPATGLEVVNVPRVKRLIQRYVTRRETENNKAVRTDELPTAQQLIPLRDENRNIVDYRVVMPHAFQEENLDPDLDIDQVLGRMEGHRVDKVASARINLEAVEELRKTYNKHYRANPRSFINILDEEYYDEYFVPLPSAARRAIKKGATETKTGKLAFYVRKQDMAVYFAHKQVSVANIVGLKKVPEYRTWMARTERLVEEAASVAVANVVIKTLPVAQANLASNTVALMLYDIDMKAAMVDQMEGLHELEKFKADSKKAVDLQLRLKADAELATPQLLNDPKIMNEYHGLLAKLESNPVRPLIDAGMFTSISEDVELREYTYFTNLGESIKRKLGVAAQPITSVAKLAYLSESTAGFQNLKHFTQTMDFVARYAMDKQLRKQGRSRKDIDRILQDTFVNYDLPMNPYLEWLNRVGGTLFVRYWMRIQRALYRTLNEKPKNVLFLLAAQEVSGVDIPDIYDSAMLLGNLTPPEGGASKILSEVINLPAFDLLNDLTGIDVDPL